MNKVVSILMVFLVTIISAYKFDECSMIPIKERNILSNEQGVFDIFQTENVTGAYFLNEDYLNANLKENGILDISTTTIYSQSGIGYTRTTLNAELQIICNDNVMHKIDFSKHIEVIDNNEPIFQNKVYNLITNVSEGYDVTVSNPIQINYDRLQKQSDTTGSKGKRWAREPRRSNEWRRVIGSTTDTAALIDTSEENTTSETNENEPSGPSGPSGPSDFKFVIGKDLIDSFETQTIINTEKRTLQLKIIAKKDIVGPSVKMIPVKVQDTRLNKTIRTFYVFLRFLQNKFTQNVYKAVYNGTDLTVLNGPIKLLYKYDPSLTTFRIVDRKHIGIHSDDSGIFVKIPKADVLFQDEEIIKIEAIFRNSYVIGETNMVLVYNPAKSTANNNNYVLILLCIFAILLNAILVFGIIYKKSPGNLDFLKQKILSNIGKQKSNSKFSEQQSLSRMPV